MTAVWPGYRLGDCVKLNRACHYPFPSLAGQYASASGGNHSNIKLLTDLVKKMKCPRPPPESMVIHLRLGDVIEKSTAPVTQMLSIGAKAAHGPHSNFEIKSFPDIHAKARKVNVSLISLVAGSHFSEYAGARAKKSHAYFACIAELLRMENFSVLPVLHLDPDQSFCYAVHARYIVLGVGGFSRLIGRVATNLGNSVVS